MFCLGVSTSLRITPPVRWAASRAHLHRLTGVGLALLLLGLTGCGYGFRSSYRNDVQTVAVPIAQNRTFYRGLEMALTEAVIKEIETRTPYKTVPQERAQTVLEITVVEVNQHVLSRTRDGGLPQELELRVVVDLHWRHVTQGETLRAVRGYQMVGRYVPSLPVGEAQFLGQQEAVQRLATQVVDQMRGAW